MDDYHSGQILIRTQRFVLLKLFIWKWALPLASNSVFARNGTSGRGGGHWGSQVERVVERAITCMMGCTTLKGSITPRWV
jgi:hypothetical protein